MKRYLLHVIFVSAICVPIGCGGDAGHPETAPVSGVLTLDGGPVEGATVKFSATGVPRAPVGITDAEGKFTLTTFDPGDGAIPGEYVVTVTKYSGGDTTTTPANPADDVMPPAPEGDTEPVLPELKNELPENYASPKTSPLNVTVPEAGLNNYAIELSGAASAAAPATP